MVALKEVLAARLDEDDEVLHSFLYDGALIWETPVCTCAVIVRMRILTIAIIRVITTIKFKCS